MSVQRVVAHPLTGSAVAPVDARTGAAFDAETYSWMKHGVRSATARLAAELAARLRVDCPWLVSDQRELVLPVAYLAAPPSCYHLAAHVGALLSQWRPGLPAARIVQVHKDSVTHIDYAASSEQERRKDLARIGFRLTESIADAKVVVIDDVRVTGLAEQTILQVIEAARPARVVAAYVASCDEGLAADPSIEAALNHAQVRSVLDVLPAVRGGDFDVTIRFLKRLLASPEVATFLAQCPRPVIDQLRTYAEATGAAFLAGYPAGATALRAASSWWVEPTPSEGKERASWIGSMAEQR